jgi:hypothetical protein
MNWHDYQNKAADFFRSLGFDAKVDHKITGARATHAIDVWVTFPHFGVEIRWLVECKFWNAAIPKEKVLTLIQIAQDVGADKAFLLSEKGFQSGAINVAKHTNIVLSNLETLVTNAHEEICKFEITISANHLNHLNDRLRALLYDKNGKWQFFSGLDPDEIVCALGVAFELQLCVNKASLEKFPIFLCGSKTDGQTQCDNPKSFAKVLKAELKQLELKTVSLEKRANEKNGWLQHASYTLLDAVENLVTVSERALFEKKEGENGFEENRLAAWAAMKELGKAFEQVRLSIPRNGAFAALYDLRNTVSDTVYLHLTKPTISYPLWDAAKQEVAAKMGRFIAVLQTENGVLLDRKASGIPKTT